MKRDAAHPVRAAAALALAGALSLGARPAEAHLMAAKRGTVNVVGSDVYTVLSVPASALHAADDDHDGLLDVAELERHEAALQAEIDRRLVILDGDKAARTVRVDLILSPDHDAAGDRADQVVVLKHATLDAPPTDLRVRCDLFGARASERELTLTATRHPASGDGDRRARPHAGDDGARLLPDGGARAGGRRRAPGPARRGRDPRARDGAPRPAARAQAVSSDGPGLTLDRSSRSRPRSGPARRSP